MILVIITFLLLLLFLGWVLLFRHFRALQIANINIVRQEQQEASLLYQLHEIKKKNHQLEDKLREVQYELYQEKQKAAHR
ncbi:hypothetical protein [Chitinophaga sp. Ak27]|uniref:hypothetical protein n=1 Tax=Chitinophaga sp. Ak27 TaxID=2726116 RepID=UPI00145CD2F0|nr:hypothetical protein [Chitinophaga sp. Ak27]NLU90556.1 hypothetical protein [Chitinophaga sp. Ak27]